MKLRDNQVSQSPKQVYRFAPWQPRLVSAWTSLGYCILLAMVGASLATAISPESPWRFAGGLPFVLAGFYGGFRATRISLTITDKGVEIVNHWSSWNLKWSNITKIRTAQLFIGSPRTVHVVAFEANGQTAPVKSQATYSARKRRKELLEILRKEADRNDITMDVLPETLSANDAAWNRNQA